MRKKKGGKVLQFNFSKEKELSSQNPLLFTLLKPYCHCFPLPVNDP